MLIAFDCDTYYNDVIRITECASCNTDYDCDYYRLRMYYRHVIRITEDGSRNTYYADDF